MGIDMNEARAIVEEARKRGLIRDAETKTPAKEEEIGHLPEWLQKGIRDPQPPAQESPDA